jgi:hypothetical protein
MSDEKWIAKATEHKGALHRHLGIPEGKKIPLSTLRKARKSKDKKIAAEARLAMILHGFNKK